MAAGIKDVANRARVSVGTVSNVLNHPDAVSELTRQRVLAAMEELAYVRNESARQLRAGRSRLIGMLVLDIANPLFMDLALGGVEAAAEADLTVILCSSAESSGKRGAWRDSSSSECRGSW